MLLSEVIFIKTIYTTFFITSTTTKTPTEVLPDSRRGFGDRGPESPGSAAEQPTRGQHVTRQAAYNYIGPTPVGGGGFKNGGVS